ncbi:MAG: peptidylprolyl isomerase [Syntrophomonadaceae bacterium]
MKKLTGFLILILICIAAAGCGAKEQPSPDIAVVNGVRINQKALDQQYTILKTNYENQLGVTLDETKDQETLARIKERAFEEVLTKELVRQEAAKQGLQVNPQEVETTLETFKQTQNAAESGGYQKILDKLQMSESDLRTEIEISQLYQLLEGKVTGDLTVGEEEAKAYYQENQALFSDPGGVRIFHILVDTEQQAQDIISKLKQGADFAALAAQYSKDPGSKDRGGDVGTVNETTNFVPEFKQAALALQPGELSPNPVKSQFGYHIIKAGTKEEPSQRSFNEEKAQLMDQLLAEKKGDTFGTYLQQLRAGAAFEDLRK